MAERKKIGELLVEGGYLEPDQLRSALSYQRQWGGRLGANVVKLGFLDEEQLVAFLSNRLRIPAVNLRFVRVPEKVIGLISAEIAKKYGMIPLQRSEDKKKMIVAMSDPTNLSAIDEVQFLVNARIIPTVASDTLLEKALRHYYDGADSLKFLASYCWSTEVDLLTAPSAAPKRKAMPVSRDAEIEETEELTEQAEDEVIVSDEADDGAGSEDMVTGEAEEDDDLGMLVFSGGKERSIPLESERAKKPAASKEQARPSQDPHTTTNPARQAQARPSQDPHTTINPARQAQTQAQGQAPKRSGAPSSEELVTALVKVLMDKGLITREELLARLNGK